MMGTIGDTRTPHVRTCSLVQRLDVRRHMAQVSERSSKNSIPHDKHTAPFVMYPANALCGKKV